MSSDGICVIDNRISSHFELNSWKSSFRRTTVNRVRIILDRIVGPSDLEAFVDQVSYLSSSEEAVFLVNFHFLQTDLFLEAGIQDDFVQCWGHFSRRVTQSLAPGIPLIEREDLRSSTDSTISTSLIHSIASERNCEQIHTSVFESYLPTDKCCWCREFLSKWRSEICSLFWSAS